MTKVILPGATWKRTNEGCHDRAPYTTRTPDGKYLEYVGEYSNIAAAMERVLLDTELFTVGEVFLFTQRRM